MKKTIFALCLAATAACAHNGRDADEPDDAFNSSNEDTGMNPGYPEGAPTGVQSESPSPTAGLPDNAAPSNARGDAEQASAGQAGANQEANANQQTNAAVGATQQRRTSNANSATTGPGADPANNAATAAERDQMQLGASTPNAGEGSPSEKSADNTGKNARDRAGTTLTPVDQSNDPNDLRITREIRKAVVAKDDLSFNAKNVKIITVDGSVTLRGPVATQQERTRIASIARETAGVVTVNDQLEVNP